ADSQNTGDAYTSFESPEINGGDFSSITQFGQNGTTPSEIQLDAAKIRVAGASSAVIGRGYVARAYQSTDSAAVTAETVVLTASSFAYQPGRSYRAHYGNLVSSSNASGRAGFRLRKAAGGLLLGYSGIITCQTPGSQQQAEGDFY